MEKEFDILNTTERDLDTVRWLFAEAMAQQGRNGYKVWDQIDEKGVAQDIELGLQYKIVRGGDILCIFSVQFSDPHIWRERDQGDAIYLHRIVVNPQHKGQRQFEKVLQWAKAFARRHGLKYVRMDTWADNPRIIAYYSSFGFTVVENYITPDIPELPLQNRNLSIVLLELEVPYP
ncbi:GNAT family N-acetyltransferase [Chitinophaga lutea]